jgi:hypothetical protein
VYTLQKNGSVENASRNAPTVEMVEGGPAIARYPLRAGGYTQPGCGRTVDDRAGQARLNRAEVDPLGGERGQRRRPAALPLSRRDPADRGSLRGFLTPRHPYAGP